MKKLVILLFVTVTILTITLFYRNSNSRIKTLVLNECTGKEECIVDLSEVVYSDWDRFYYNSYIPTSEYMKKNYQLSEDIDTFDTDTRSIYLFAKGNKSVYDEKISFSSVDSGMDNYYIDNSFVINIPTFFEVDKKKSILIRFKTNKDSGCKNCFIGEFINPDES